MNARLLQSLIRSYHPKRRQFRRGDRMDLGEPDMLQKEGQWLSLSFHHRKEVRCSQVSFLVAEQEYQYRL